MNNSIEDLEGEVWRPVPNWAKFYLVSNYGRIQSLPRIVNKLYPYLKKGRLLRLVTMADEGYLVVTLYGEKTHNLMRVHRLVAMAFIANPNHKPHINHINGDKTDNRVENLEWCTIAENNHHAKINGLTTHTKGVEKSWAQLKDADVVAMRLLYSKGNSYIKITKMYGLKYDTIRAAIKGITWKHIK